MYVCMCSAHCLSFPLNNWIRNLLENNFRTIVSTFLLFQPKIKYLVPLRHIDVFGFKERLSCRHYVHFTGKCFPVIQPPPCSPPAMLRCPQLPLYPPPHQMRCVAGRVSPLLTRSPPGTRTGPVPVSDTHRHPLTLSLTHSSNMLLYSYLWLVFPSSLGPQQSTVKLPPSTGHRASVGDGLLPATDHQGSGSYWSVSFSITYLMSFTAESIITTTDWMKYCQFMWFQFFPGPLYYIIYLFCWHFYAKQLTITGFKNEDKTQKLQESCK